MEFEPVQQEEVDVLEAAGGAKRVLSRGARVLVGVVTVLCAVVLGLLKVDLLKIRSSGVSQKEEDHVYTDARPVYTGISGAQCRVAEGRECSISELSQTEPTTIFPGGNTKCIWGDEYGFTYYPGDSDKLLVFFGGGAACWKSPTGDIFTGCRQVLPEDPFLEGIWDSNDVRNPFRSHAKLYIHYCSGDVHTGDSSDTWAMESGEQVANFNGFKNVLSALTWAKKNAGNSAVGKGRRLSGRLSNLLIGGSSAGAFATMIWSGYVIDLLPSDTAVAFYDSSTGFTPPGTIPYLFKSHWGSCPTQAFINGEDSIQARDCVDGKADLIYLPGLLAEKYPQALFAVLEPKADHVQRGLYTAMVKTFHLEDQVPSVEVSGPSLYATTNAIYAKNMAKATCSNYLIFYADSEVHCFVLHDNFYSTTTGGDNFEKGVALTEWMAPLAFGQKPTLLVACEGTLVDTDATTSVDLASTITYCDSALKYSSQPNACGISSPSASMPSDVAVAMTLQSR